MEFSRTRKVTRRKSKIYLVVNNRMQFRCSACGAKRNMPVARKIRSKNVHCHKCKAVTKCRLNRRTRPREMQSGKALMVLNDGKEVEIDLFDISSGGLGFDMPIAAARSCKIKVGQKIKFKCNWNPHLINQNRFTVKSIHGQRVGAEIVLRG